MPKKILTREQMVERLKAMAADKSQRIESFGAMCYSPAAPPVIETVCDKCGKTFKYQGWDFQYKDIQHIVQEMQHLGYDAKVEAWCSACTRQLTEHIKNAHDSNDECDNDETESFYYIEGINFVFYFRLEADRPYHLAIANSEESYKALLALLKNHTFFKTSRDEYIYLTDEKKTLAYMTGINFDE